MRSTLPQTERDRREAEYGIQQLSRRYNASDDRSRGTAWDGRVSVDDSYKPHPLRAPAAPRTRQPGEEVWRRRDNETGRVQTCELRDNSRAGAGWEVQILEAGEILVSRRRANEQEARYVAEAEKNDSLRTGSVPIVD
jgi:hypothetical protein